MKPLENAWNGLVQRKLLPLAILLLAAIVAIPFLLSKDPEPLPAAPASPSAAAASESEDSIAQPVVSQVDANAPAERRRVLGYKKNPFAPAPAPKAKASDEANAAEVPAPTGGATPEKDEPADSGSGSGSGSAPSGGAPAAPVAPATPVEPAEPQAKQELYSVTVRFGDSESDALEKSVLPRLKALPSASDPLLIYLGPGKGGKTAVFMVDETMQPQGDGECKPSPANCETLHLRTGDTEFLDVLDESGELTAQYQLDVVKIKTRKASAAKAAAARAKASKAGLSVLKARQAAVGPLRYRYEAKSGLVRKLDKRAYKALLAKSARVALGTAGGF
jgi:hypothetical protein